jgi:hypothetical protein
LNRGAFRLSSSGAMMSSGRETIVLSGIVDEDRVPDRRL